MADVEALLLGHLSRDPAASMAELGRAAGMSRATLFRRYPSRQELVLALSRRAVDELSGALDRAAPESGPAVQALERVCAEVAGLGPGLAMLAVQPLSSEREAELLEAFAASEARLVGLVERGRSEGDFPAGADPVWVLSVLTWLTVGAADEVRRGRLAPARVPDLLTRAVLASTGAGGRTG